ncbi:MAG: hypothetical protein OEN20_08775, partial [Gammaproteobacteria bacterium]|nr:hypothetical protein [Gammaproteobacteria bacterium]
MRIRSIAYVALVVGVALAALLAGSGWLIGTTAGARWLAEKIPGLKAEITHGTLLSGISAAMLTWQDETRFIEVRDLAADWEARCFLQRRWCVSQLRIGSVAAVLPPADQPA